MIARLRQYLSERFPLPQFIPLCLMFAACASLGVRAGIGIHPLPFSSVVFSACALLLFLFRLRLFDDQKDHVHDQEHYPDRPVSRGLIRLNELSLMTTIVFVLECIVARAGGYQSILFFLIAAGYSFVMRKEFFVREWLRSHFSWYVFSHEVLAIPLFWYVMSFSGFSFVHIFTARAWLMVGFLTASIFLLEVTRKTRVSSDERPSRDTYSAQYGLSKTLLLAAGIGTVLVACARAFNIQSFFYTLSFLVIFFIILGIAYKRQDRVSVRRVHIASILLVFAVQCILILSWSMV